MYMTDNLPFVMTCDAVETPTEDENVHIKVPFKVANQDVEEPAGDDAGEGEPSQAIMDAAPTPPAMKHSGKIVHIVRKIKVVPEKVKDEIQDSLAKDEAIAMDKRTVATSAADCKAKNKFRCPYHGAAAMSDAFRDILDKRGLGDMKFTIKPFDEGDEDDTSYILDFECPEEKVDTVGMDALKDFGKLKGIVIDTDDTEGLVEKTEEGRREALFEVDFFDKAAEDPVSDAGEGKGHEEEKAEPKPEEGEKETVKEEPSEDKRDEKDDKDDSEEDKDVKEEKKEEDEPSTETSKKEVEYEDVEDDSAEAEEESTDEDEIVPAEKHDIPTDPVERAMKAAKDFESLISESKRKSMSEYKSQCDECAKDIDFLQKAVDTAPNDRMKKKMTDKFDAANKRMMMLQSELKHSCGDAMRELKSNIGKSVADASACEVKMEHDSGRDIKKEINSLKEDLGLKSITKVDGYKEMRKAEKEFDAAKSQFDKLMDAYNDASDNDDYLSMVHYGEAVKKHIGTCNAASETLKSSRENVKAAMVKKLDEIRKEKYASMPPEKRIRGALKGETIKDWIDRQKAMGQEIPLSLVRHQECIDRKEKRWMDRKGMSKDDLALIKKNLKATISNVMEKMPMGTWCKTKVGLKGMLDDHFKSLIETNPGSSYGSGGGCTHKATRTRMAEDCFGINSRVMPDSGWSDMEFARGYEKYGSWTVDDDPKHDSDSKGKCYGDCYVRFKKDKVVASFTCGDSLSHDGFACPSFLTDPSPVSLLGCEYDGSAVYEALKKGPIKAKDSNDLKKKLGGGSYLEFQFHGMLTPDVIESINFSYSGQYESLSAKHKKLIKDLGIVCYVDGEKIET